MPVTVVNLQRKTRIDTAIVREFSRQIVNTVPEALSKAFSVAFVSDLRMKELNNFFRGKDSTTDVLSFPHDPDEFELKAPVAPAPDPDASADLGYQFLGDIVISAEQAARQAEENGLPLDGEIKQLILHGLLHLCGYDHETDSGQMLALQARVLERL